MAISALSNPVAPTSSMRYRSRRRGAARSPGVLSPSPNQRHERWHLTSGRRGVRVDTFNSAPPVAKDSVGRQKNLVRFASSPQGAKSPRANEAQALAHRKPAPTASQAATPAQLPRRCHFSATGHSVATGTSARLVAPAVRRKHNGRGQNRRQGRTAARAVSSARRRGNPDAFRTRKGATFSQRNLTDSPARQLHRLVHSPLAAAPRHMLVSARYVPFQ